MEHKNPEEDKNLTLSINFLPSLTLFGAGRGGFWPRDFFDRSTVKDCKSGGLGGIKIYVIVLGRHLKRFQVKKSFESGPEAVKVGLAENLRDSKSGFFNFQLEFLPQNQ